MRNRNVKPLITQSLFALACVAAWSSQTSIAQDSTTAPTGAPQNASQGSTQSLSSRSKQITQQRIERESNQATQKENVRPVAEALSAVQETQTAVQLLDQNKPDQAKAALVRAVGKTDIVLSAHPNLALVPVSADIRVIDTLVDEPTLKRVTGTVKDLVKQGRYQPARLLLRDLASEIDITTVNLPIATYPNAIRMASRLIDQGKPQEAKAALMAALQTLAISESAVPLPVVRAQALVDEVTRQASEKKIDKKQADQILSEADQQLAWAEKLGYGTRKQDFGDLHASIQDVRKTIDKNQEPKNMLAKVKDGLESLKQRLSKPLTSPA
jgi:hypothetical protein